MTFLADIDPDNPLTPLQAASCTYRIALGPRAGQKVLGLRTVPRRDERPSATVLCADAHGFSLHAGVRCGEHQRKELERPCRYITRPAIANERLGRNDKGQVVLQRKSPWRDGTTHIVMSPLEFMQRLAALVPRPRLHLIRFHGVLAPNAGLRAAIVPGPAEKPGDDAAHHAHGALARLGWARLLKRVFDLDLEHCPQCGGDMKIIAAIEEPAVIVRILTHLGLPARAPPRSPARPTLAWGGQRASRSAPTGRRRDRRIHAARRSSPNTARLTAWRAADNVAQGEKGGLKFPYAMSRPAPKIAGQQIRWAFVILVDGTSLANSNSWMKIQWPYVGRVDGKDVRASTVIQTVRTK